VVFLFVRSGLVIRLIAINGKKSIRF